MAERARIDQDAMKSLSAIFSAFLPVGCLYGKVEAAKHPLKADIIIVLLAGAIFWLVLVS